MLSSAPASLFGIFRDAVRPFQRSGTTAAAAAAMLALGLGANIAIFAVAYAVLLRPLPIRDANRVVVMWEHAATAAVGVWEVSYPDFRDWQTQNSSFGALAATGSINWPLRLMQADGPVPLTFAAVSGTFFDVLGARPQLGRALSPADDEPRSTRVAVISDAAWRDRFASNPNIVGTAITIDDGAGIAPVTIVGVMPRDFDYPRGAALWMPIVPTLSRQSAEAGYDMLEDRRLGILFVVGRLRNGVTLERARAEIDAIIDRIPASTAAAARRSSVLTPLPDYLFGQTGTALRFLILGGAIVVLLTCANAVALLLARFARDRRSLFIRCALGAERRHLFRQAITEAGGLAAAALVGGFLCALWVARAARALAADTVPRINDVTITAPAVIGYAAVAAVLVALACGVLPLGIALRQSSIQGLAATADTRTSTLRVRYGLVLGQTALAVTLLVVAGLTARSFAAVRHVYLGFNPADLITFDVTAPSRTYANTALNQQFYRAALDNVRALPGVADAAGVFLRPFDYGAIGSGAAVVLEGEDPAAENAWRKHPAVNAESVTPDYFRMMGISLLQGRGFTDADGPKGPPGVIVSAAAAERLWPGQNPIGKRIYASYDRPPGDWQTVVGVVSDVRYRGLGEKTLETLYKPYLQSIDPVQHFIVRPTGPAYAFVGGLRSAIRQVHPHAVVDAVRPLAAVVDREIEPWRFQTYVFTALSCVALLVALSGVFATLAQHVAEQTREIGIRVALGARRAQIVSWLAGRTFRLIIVAAALGIATAAVSSRILAALLFGVSPVDPVSYIAAVVIVMGGAMAGAWLPLRRATLLDPIEALRRE
ncbi:MAG TPA: ADOP family duplicated permease [Vicinamibacterales bacterium]|nr:ADOP family duplicated permease [Vicinamibacterales bacterium]